MLLCCAKRKYEGCKCDPKISVISNQTILGPKMQFRFGCVWMHRIEKIKWDPHLGLFWQATASVVTRQENMSICQRTSLLFSKCRQHATVVTSMNMTVDYHSSSCPSCWPFVLTSHSQRVGLFRSLIDSGLPQRTVDMLTAGHGPSNHIYNLWAMNLFFFWFKGHESWSTGFSTKHIF